MVKAKPIVLRLVACGMIVLLSSVVAPCQSEQKELALLRVTALEYPWFARVAFLQGTVELMATISPDGIVTKARILSGPTPLAQPALETLLKWRFTSQSRERDAKFSFSFVLDGSCEACSHCPPAFEVDRPDKIRVTAKSIRAMVN